MFKAGLPDNMLRIALEPEAASVFCEQLPLEKLGGASEGFDISKPGTKYMLIDLGGNCCDENQTHKICLTKNSAK